jgi:hypothetical protein
MSTGKAPWLLVAWLLWRAVAPVLPNAPTEGARVLQSHEARDDCLKAASVKRTRRNVVSLNGKPAYEVFACLPVGTNPAAVTFK